MVDFSKNIYLEEFSFREMAELQPLQLLESDIPTSEQISGIEVRLSRAHVKDNRTPRLGPFPGLAKVYILNLVVSDIAEAQLEINLEGFEKVNDNQTLAVDRTIFFWKKTESTPRPPSQIHIMTSLIKSKKSLRKAGTIMAAAENDPGIRSLKEDLVGFIKSGAVGNISKTVLKIAGIIGNLLNEVEDKPLLTRFQSFTDIGGNFNQLGEKEHSFENNFAVLAYKVFVRDAARQREAGEPTKVEVITV